MGNSMANIWASHGFSDVFLCSFQAGFQGNLCPKADGLRMFGGIFSAFLDAQRNDFWRWMNQESCSQSLAPP